MRFSNLVKEKFLGVGQAMLQRAGAWLPLFGQA
jgi:hypothetical protein